MNITGKKVFVQVGGVSQQKDPNEIVGSETNLYIPESEVGKYDRIVGEEISVNIGSEIDDQVRLILEEIKNTESDKKDEIIILGNEKLKTNDKTSKFSLARNLVSFGSDVAQITSLIVQLHEITKTCC